MQNKKVQKMSMFQNILQTFYIKLPNVFQRTQILFLYKKKSQILLKILSTYFYHTQIKHFHTSKTNIKLFYL